VIRDSFRSDGSTSVTDLTVVRAASSIIAPKAKVIAPKAKVVAPAAKARTKAATAAKATKPVVRKAATASRPVSAHTGTNRLWIPSLGLSQRIYTWGCRPGTLPNRVYRWTCTGRNNLVLLGHSSGVFSRIHNYYAAHHRMPRAAYLLYANSQGNVQRYNLVWTRIITDASIYNGNDRTLTTASLSRPTITLITCYGTGVLRRLVTRWVLAS
jgi:sortase (surface protein transpeptidase)